MKYRLAYDRGVVCMHECPVFRLQSESTRQIIPAGLSFMVDPIVEHDKRNPREKLHAWRKFCEKFKSHCDYTRIIHITHAIHGVIIVWFI